ncbi:MAG: S8 family serine peptidase [Bifidobacteriaceae bacterium]|jgi:hypothetical protein|nr:S8 family serine peptidase [Bifidobacteriaceae bacterium]
MHHCAARVLSVLVAIALSAATAAAPSAAHDDGATLGDRAAAIVRVGPRPGASDPASGTGASEADAATDGVGATVAEPTPESVDTVAGPQLDPASDHVNPRRIVALARQQTTARDVQSEVAEVAAGLPRGSHARVVAVPVDQTGSTTPGAPQVVVVDIDDASGASVAADMVASGLYSAVDYEAQATPHFTDVPNDPYFFDPESWGLRDHPGGAFNTAWTELSDAEGTWNTAPIASIDTGFAMDAPDRGTAIQAVWDYGENDADVSPKPGVPDGQHGTGTAGIMGAATDNGFGGSGATWNNQILIYKAADSNGTLQYSAVTNAIIAATAAGAKVITMSLGSPDFPSYVQAAIDQAIAQGVTVIASSGNDAGNTVDGIANPIQYPAAYEPVISVSAVDSSGGWASFSTYNAGVDIAAPGVGILVMDQDFEGGYAVADGTSEAAPFVAATAALMLRERPGLSASQIQSVLCATATDVAVAPAAPGKDAYTGCGIVNAHAAVVGARTAPIMPTFNPENGGRVEVTAGDTVSMHLGVHGDPPPAVDIADETPLPTAIGLFFEGGDWVIRGQAHKAGTFTVNVEADSRGERAILPLTIIIHPGPAAQIRAVPSAEFMKNTHRLSVKVTGTDQFGNPVPALTPAEAASASVSYSIAPKCRFPTGEKPSYRVCRISVHYAGALQAVPSTVRVYDTKEFTTAVTGTLKPGKKLTASIPKGWKNLTYRWYRDGRPIVGATTRTYSIPKDTPGSAKFQVQVKIPGVAVKKSTVAQMGKTIPTVSLKKSGKTLTLRVVARGIKRPTGTIVVHYSGHTAKYKLKTSHGGVIKLAMPTGRFAVSVDYRGNSRIAARSTSPKTYSF